MPGWCNRWQHHISKRGRGGRLAGCCVASPDAALLFFCCPALSLRQLAVAWPLPSAAAAIKHHCHRSLLSTAPTTAAAVATGIPPPPPPPLQSNSPSSMAKKRGNSSTTTSGPTAAPTWKCWQVQTTWTYLSYLQYQGNLEISNLLAWKKLYLQTNRGCAMEAVNSHWVSRYRNRFYKVGVGGINGRH